MNVVRRGARCLQFGLSLVLVGCWASGRADAVAAGSSSVAARSDGAPGRGLGSASPPTTDAPVPSSAPTAVPPPEIPANEAAARGPDAAATGPQAIGVEKALLLLQLERESPGVATCLSETGEPGQIRCLLRLRFAADARAAELAVGLYDDLGDVVGLEAEQLMDGGWRGDVHLVPELPIGRYRKHLEWVAEARRDTARFFAKLGEGGARVPAFGHRPLSLLFTRSVGKRTPSAFASGWRIAYNVEGSLHRDARSVRETMFHENFHLADAAHGHWSERVLGPAYDERMRLCEVEKRVVASRICLAPYAPHKTTVVGGTYYAFHPGNGVAEYGAELAVRYYEEHVAAMAGKSFAGGWFKCGPAENARAWSLMAEEFFGGIDRTPPCR